MYNIEQVLVWRTFIKYYLKQYLISSDSIIMKARRRRLISLKVNLFKQYYLIYVDVDVKVCVKGIVSKMKQTPSLSNLYWILEFCLTTLEKDNLL